MFACTSLRVLSWDRMTSSSIVVDVTGAFAQKNTARGLEMLTAYAANKCAISRPLSNISILDEVSQVLAHYDSPQSSKRKA